MESDKCMCKSRLKSFDKLLCDLVSEMPLDGGQESIRPVLMGICLCQNYFSFQESLLDCKSSLDGGQLQVRRG